MAIGCLIIAILFTALLGPYFVDWTAYREIFEQRASAYIGRPVAIAGKASLRILPTPVISFADVRIGDAGSPDIAIERIRAEVELAPLLKGEVRVIQMTVERPLVRFDLARLAAAGPPTPGGSRLDAERVSLANLVVSGGTALLSDSRAGREWRLTGIDAVIDATSLRGPARIESTLTFDGSPLVVRVGLGRAVTPDSVAAKVSVSSPAFPLTLAADGVIEVKADAPAAYRGNVTVAAPETADPAEAGEDDESFPWADFRAVGAFELTPLAIRVAEAQLSYGGLERPLVLQAAGRVDLGAEPRFDASVKARQVDIDRTLGGGAERPVPIADAVQATIDALPRLPAAPLPGTLRLEAEGVVVGGGVIQAVGGQFTTAEGGWRVERLAAVLPGETRIDLEGLLRMSDAPSFQGHGRIAARRPAALAAWWRGRSGSAAALGRFAAEADLDLGPDLQNITAISAETGAGTISGSVELRRFEQSRQRFATVALAADRADLAETRALAELLLGENLAGGHVDQMTMVLRADAFSAGGVAARTVFLDGGFENGELKLNRFTIGDLAGASLEARGAVDDPFGSPAGSLDVSVTAEQIAGAAAFLAQLLPDDPWVARLGELAPRLSPVDAKLTIAGGAEGEKLALDLTGAFAETHLTLSASGQGSLGRPESLNGTLELHVDGEDTAEVLGQLGLAVLPVGAGPLRIDAEFRGGLDSPGTLQLDGTVAGVRVTYAGETLPEDDGVKLAGDFEAEAIDIDPALLLAGFAAPGIGEGHAASATGRLEAKGRVWRMDLSRASFDGAPVGGSLQAAFGETVELSGALELEELSLPLLAGIVLGAPLAPGADGWSDAALAAAMPPNLAIDASLSAKTLDIGLERQATDARLGVSLVDGDLNIDLLESGFAGGALTGAIDGGLDAEGAARLALRAALSRAELQALVWERDVLPVVAGRLDASFDAAGDGRSVAALVAGLSGSGSFAIEAGRFNSLDPEAIDAVVEAAAADLDPDVEQAREIFASRFRSGSLAVGRSAGSFSIAGGVVDVPTVSIVAGATEILAEGRFDMNGFTMSSELTMRRNLQETPSGAEPFVRIRFSGPITEPERQVDIDPLIDFLRSRNLQRQLDELEALELERRRLETLREQTEARLEAEQREAERREAERQRLEAERLDRLLKFRPAAPATDAGASPSAAPPSSPPGGVEPGRATAADQADAAPLDLLPGLHDPGPAPDIVRRIGPVIRDFIRGDAGRPPATP